MPLHDWTRVNAGLFHHFHQGWCWEISGALNRGQLPDGYTALVEQRSGSKEKASRVVIRHQLGRVVAFIEIVSPGNKHDDLSLENFCEKIVEAIRGRVHVLVLDLFPPTRRDPFGIHKAIWDHFEDDDPIEAAAPQNRFFASYEADGVNTAYIETLAVGDPLPRMPLFIAPGAHILIPLEDSYIQTWTDTPRSVRQLVE